MPTGAQAIQRLWTDPFTDLGFDGTLDGKGRLWRLKRVRESRPG